jgi:hypothetical protein
MKWHNFTLLFVIFPAIVLEIIIIFWLIYPYKPLEILEAPKVKQKTVKAGEILEYTIKFKKNTDIPASITRTLVDGVLYTLPTLSPINRKGTQTQTISSLEIPRSIPSGKYYFLTSSCYQMNPLRTVCVEYKSDQFEVIK